MWDCAPASLPSLLGDAFPWNLSQKSDRVTLRYEHDETVRTVWMDGRRHPFVGELFYMGHSIGWYEGETLVIDTTNFTFDPDGMDDHGHIATSVRKRLTERYTRSGPDSMEMAITLEDTLFSDRALYLGTPTQPVGRRTPELGGMRPGPVEGDNWNHSHRSTTIRAGPIRRAAHETYDYRRIDQRGPANVCDRAGSPYADHVSISWTSRLRSPGW